MCEKRPIRIEGAVAYITLTQGCIALIDAEDVPLVSGYDWTVLHSARTSYARRNQWSPSAQKTILLHRVVLGEPVGLRIDHKDGNGLDCRKANLRFATYRQNNTNTRTRADNRTGLKGVSKHSLCNKYRAAISLDGVRRDLGLFETAELAHAAYCAASAQLHREFGRTK